MPGLTYWERKRFQSRGASKPGYSKSLKIATPTHAEAKAQPKAQPVETGARLPDRKIPPESESAFLNESIGGEITPANFSNDLHQNVSDRNQVTDGAFARTDEESLREVSPTGVVSDESAASGTLADEVPEAEPPSNQVTDPAVTPKARKSRKKADPVSQQKIDANRRNAQNSTGPKSERGKRRSRSNALNTRAHLRSRDPGLLGRRARGRIGLSQIVRALREDLEPVGALEERLVAKIAMLLVEGRARRPLRVRCRHATVFQVPNRDDGTRSP